MGTAAEYDDMTAEEQIVAYEELLQWLKVEFINRQMTILSDKKPGHDWFFRAQYCANPISCDYYVAHGWFDRMLRHLKESEFEEANAAGRNMLDAVLRSLTRIGIDKEVFDEFLRFRGFDIKPAA